jgi:hypothetical protein
MHVTPVGGHVCLEVPHRVALSLGVLGLHWTDLYRVLGHHVNSPVQKSTARAPTPPHSSKQTLQPAQQQGKVGKRNSKGKVGLGWEGEEESQRSAPQNGIAPIS